MASIIILTTDDIQVGSDLGDGVIKLMLYQGLWQDDSHGHAQRCHPRRLRNLRNPNQEQILIQPLWGRPLSDLLQVQEQRHRVPLPLLPPFVPVRV